MGISCACLDSVLAVQRVGQSRSGPRLHAVQGSEDEGAACPGQVGGLLRLQRRRLRRQAADLPTGRSKRLRSVGALVCMQDHKLTIVP